MDKRNVLKHKDLQITELSMQEIWLATKGGVQKTKKQYTRKVKHRNIDK